MSEFVFEIIRSRPDRDIVIDTIIKSLKVNKEIGDNLVEKCDELTEETKQHIKEDLDRLTVEEISKVYKFVRSLIVNV